MSKHKDHVRGLCCEPSLPLLWRLRYTFPTCPLPVHRASDEDEHEHETDCAVLMVTDGADDAGDADDAADHDDADAAAADD